MRILFTGGGTGGHFYPIVAVAEEIKRIAGEEKILKLALYYIGPDDFGSEILKNIGIKNIAILSGKWRRYGSVQNFLDILKIIAGTLKAFWILFKIMPDVIFSKGGYGSIPVVIVAAIYHIPLMIQESDSIPGVANKFAARFALKIAVSFAPTLEYFSAKKTALIGNPVRKNILGGNREKALAELMISGNRPALLIMGGSQGSDIINQVIITSLKEFTREFEVMHVTGGSNFETVKNEAGAILSKEAAIYYHPYGFLDERMLKNVYAAADCVISRAGAGSIFEISAIGKPSILIPLKNSAQEHQRSNAYEYARTGASVVIEEDNLSPNILVNEIRKLFADAARRAEMSERAKHFSKINAAEVIARELLKLGLH